MTTKTGVWPSASAFQNKPWQRVSEDETSLIGSDANGFRSRFRDVIYARQSPANNSVIVGILRSPRIVLDSLSGETTSTPTTTTTPAPTTTTTTTIGPTSTTLPPPPTTTTIPP